MLQETNTDIIHSLTSVVM